MTSLRVLLLALVALAAGVVASTDAQMVLLAVDTINPQEGASFGYSVAERYLNGESKGDIAGRNTRAGCARHSSRAP